MIAKRITIARQDKKEIIHKLELTKLSDQALDVVAQNYMLYPELKGLDNKTKLKVSFFINVRFMIEPLWIILLKLLSL
jgi:hypothetical protein